MKQLVLTFCIALLQMYDLFGQNPACIANPIYKDSAAGIYPRPYNDSLKTGGITKVACIDNDYEFPLTINIPDTIVVPVFGMPQTIGLISARIDTANAVSGMPKGLRYLCAPGNCVYEKNKLGCIVIKGKPTADNKPGDYDLVISLKLSTNLGTFDVTFPGTLFPGKYFIRVAEKGNAACLTSDVKSLQLFEGKITSYPNPTKDLLNVSIFSLHQGQSTLIIRDLTGRSVYQKKFNLTKGDNEFYIPTDDLANGSYFYTLSQDGRSATKKFTILK